MGADDCCQRCQISAEPPGTSHTHVIQLFSYIASESNSEIYGEGDMSSNVCYTYVYCMCITFRRQICIYSTMWQYLDLPWALGEPPVSYTTYKLHVYVLVLLYRIDIVDARSTPGFIEIHFAHRSHTQTQPTSIIDPNVSHGMHTILCLVCVPIFTML